MSSNLTAQTICGWFVQLDRTRDYESRDRGSNPLPATISNTTVKKRRIKLHEIESGATVVKLL